MSAGLKFPAGVERVFSMDINFFFKKHENPHPGTYWKTRPGPAETNLTWSTTYPSQQKDQVKPPKSVTSSVPKRSFTTQTLCLHMQTEKKVIACSPTLSDDVLRRVWQYTAERLLPSPPISVPGAPYWESQLS